MRWVDVEVTEGSLTKGTANRLSTAGVRVVERWVRNIGRFGSYGRTREEREAVVGYLLASRVVATSIVARRTIRNLRREPRKAVLDHLLANDVAATT